ncbi:MAG: squalene/phytoene synthase family protein [Albidovulum sp.]
MSLHACAAMVEAGDPDRFAATMAAPPAARTRLWPLYAFNLEVARAAYASDEPLVAEMRLQWWVDEVARLASGSPPQGDVAAALQPMLREDPGLGALLAAIAEARRWDCWREAFADRAGFETYLNATSGNLVWAAARALGAGAEAEVPVRDFAFGVGLANWFDAVPALMARGRLPLPDPSCDAIARLAASGLGRMENARAHHQRVPKSARPALWPGWSAARRLVVAQGAPERVFDGNLPAPDPSRALALLWRVFSGRW